MPNTVLNQKNFFADRSQDGQLPSRQEGRSRRVMYLLSHYPQMSETYMDTEIAALRSDYDIRILSRNSTTKNQTAPANHFPFSVIRRGTDVARAIIEFKPDVIHTHWLFQCRQILDIARYCNVPFTIRAHSFDTIPSPDPRRIVQQWFANAKPILTEVSRDELCLGIIAFPFSRPFLLDAGVPDDKIHDCYPLVNYDRFYDRSDNGPDIMNTGACIQKKKMEDFLELARQVREKQFRLYPVSYNVDAIRAANERMGGFVEIMHPVEPEDMPAAYKRHQWMVYTACPRLRNVGWPLAVAEAQASGVGVVLANIRPDMRQYIGDAGFLYDDLAQARRIISEPVPDEIRELGFERAKLCDINNHKSILTDLWG